MAGNMQQRIAAIEARLGPVGAGHHNAHRTTHIQQWLEGKQESGAGFPAKGGSKVSSSNHGHSAQHGDLPPWLTPKGKKKPGHAFLPKDSKAEDAKDGGRDDAAEQGGKPGSSSKRSAAVQKRLANLKKGN